MQENQKGKSLFPIARDVLDTRDYGSPSTFPCGTSLLTMAPGVSQDVSPSVLGVSGYD